MDRWMTEDGYVLKPHEVSRARDRHDTDNEHFYLDGNVCLICDEPAPTLTHPVMQQIRDQLTEMGFEPTESDDDHEMWSRSFSPQHDSVYVDIKLSVVLP